MVDSPLFQKWPRFSEAEIEAAARVLRSGDVNYWTGQECRSFETEFAEWVGSKYAIAVANGSVSLELALRALGVGKGDEVVVTSRTFLASVSSIVLVGAVPIFADVCLDSQNITRDSIAAVLSPRTKAILCVHLNGWPCEMDPIVELAKKHNLFVIEDCAQAHGASYKGRAVGSIGDIGSWSFCQDKIMTTGGEGGLVTTNDESLWSKMWSYKDHGKSYEAVYHRDHPPGHRYYCDSFGTNWRMTEMQGAIGRIQLGLVEAWVAQRTQYARMLDEVAVDFPGIRAPQPAEHILHARYKHYFFVETEWLQSGWSRDRIVSEIAELGVYCVQGTCSEVYLEKAFEGTGWRPPIRLPNAKLLGDTSLMLLIHPTLELAYLKRCQEVLRKVFSQAFVQTTKK